MELHQYILELNEIKKYNEHMNKFIEITINQNVNYTKGSKRQRKYLPSKFSLITWTQTSANLGTSV